MMRFVPDKTCGAASALPSDQLVFPAGLATDATTPAAHVFEPGAAVAASAGPCGTLPSPANTETDDRQDR